MTEDEAIKDIKREACNDRCSRIHCSDKCIHGIEHCAFSLAINALEDIQKYRAIGTVEEFRILKDCVDCSALGAMRGDKYGKSDEGT